MKTSPKRSYLVIENERFGLVFAKTGSIISGTGLLKSVKISTKDCRGRRKPTVVAKKTRSHAAGTMHKNRSKGCYKIKSL